MEYRNRYNLSPEEMKKLSVLSGRRNKLRKKISILSAQLPENEELSDFDVEIAHIEEIQRELAALRLDIRKIKGVELI